MPRKKQTPLLATRVGAADYLRLDQICRAEGKTRTDILRRALIEFLDRYDQGPQETVRDQLAEILEKMEVQRRKDTDRLAKLMVRTLMDVGTMHQVFYKRAPAEDRKQLWESAEASAAERLKRKRKGRDPQATEVLDALSSEA